jgi:two-component system cell cycle response regulator PopA
MRDSLMNDDFKVSVISGDHERAEYICDTLDKIGISAFPGDFSTPSHGYLLDMKHCRLPVLEDIVAYAHSVRMQPPLIATLGSIPSRSNIKDKVDVQLSSDSALPLAGVRFHFAKRRAARRAEMKLRQESFGNYGLESLPSKKSPNRNIIYIGGASQKFPTLQKALQAHDLNLTAAFSPSAAFDYLHDQRFAAVVLDTESTGMKPDNFCSMVRRSPNLTDIPMILLSDVTTEITDNMINSASDIVDNFVPPAQVASALADLIDNTGPSSPDFVPITPNKEILDSETGVFAQQFFEEHLARQVQWSKEYDQPLTLMAVKIVSYGEDKPEIRDLAYTARIVKALLRIQDTPTRMNDSTLLVSMPGSDIRSAEIAAKRIEGVLDVTAFENESGAQSRQVSIDWHLSELKPHQDANQLINSAIHSGPFSKSAVA